MRIGFMTNILVRYGMKSLADLAAWGAANGFEDMEVGPTIPLEQADFEHVQQQGAIGITALTYCRNFLSSDEEEAANHLRELEQRIRFAGALGIEKIVTSTGIDKTVEEGVYDKADAIRRMPARSLERVKKTFTPLVELAEQSGVKLCFENCPLMGNIAIAPVLWRQVLDALPSVNVGLAYDPSHLVWQFIDAYAAIEEFGDKIYHMHAKDTVIDRAVLARTGILADFSWWSYRIPGAGELDWQRIFTLLRAAGYEGTVSMEHEDADYEGDLASVQQGLLKGKAHLLANM